MEGTLAEIRMFAGNFAPRGWMLCNGQLLAISQWTAVFALVGTTYGGNGQTTFGVPDFRGRLAVGTGTGPGLPAMTLGEMAGTQTTTLISVNLPAHNHLVSGNINMTANNDTQNSSDPTGRRLAAAAVYSNQSSELVTMAPLNINLPASIAGSNLPFSIEQPYTGINFIFCVEGIFPSRD